MLNSHFIYVSKNENLKEGGRVMESKKLSGTREVIQVIHDQDVLGKPFKIYGTAKKPMFLAKDVAEWIAYDTSSLNKMLKNVEDEEKVNGIIFREGQHREMWFLTEDGVYEVLMQSRKPIAKAFKKKVKEILKEIRQHGMYARDELLDNPDLLIQVASKLKEEREMRKQLELKIQAQAPKVLFADAVTISQSSILVGELAKLIHQNGISIGQNRLFTWLRDHGYLIKKRGNDYNMPTQRAMNLGLFEIKEGTRIHSDGHVSITKTSKVTGKGQVYFINKFLENKLVKGEL